MPLHELPAEKEHPGSHLLLLHRDQKGRRQVRQDPAGLSGTPDQIFEKCSAALEPGLPVKTSHLEFGLAAAPVPQALELGVIPLINSYAAGTSAYLDVGQYLVLAAINRVCEPKVRTESPHGTRRACCPVCSRFL